MPSIRSGVWTSPTFTCRKKGGHIWPPLWSCTNVKNTEGIILHSDLGGQYTSNLFEGYLAWKGILHSFSRKGNPYDNACIEPFHSVLKKEEVHCRVYQDYKEASRAIFKYIESWYNRKRIYSAIDYMTPQQKEDEELKKWYRLSNFFVQGIDIGSTPYSYYSCSFYGQFGKRYWSDCSIGQRQYSRTKKRSWIKYKKQAMRSEYEGTGYDRCWKVDWVN